MRDLLTDADPDRRWWAARALAAVGTAAAKELLIGALADADLRACAAQGLGELRADAAVASLVHRLADSSPFVSPVAADALARIGLPAVPALIVAFEARQVLVRAGEARVLNIIQPQEAIPALSAALDDPSAVVTHYAEHALERMGVGGILIRP